VSSQRPDQADLEAIAGRIVTGRFQTWKPEVGIPIRTSIGRPRSWRHAEQPIHDRDITPYGVAFNAEVEAMPDGGRSVYLDRLDARAGRIVARLAALARQHPGRQLVVLCYENVAAGDVCHRRWLADWLEDRFGIAADEVG
jgi:hypothetical protein